VPPVDDSYRLLAVRYIRKQLRALSEHGDGARKARDVECVHQARVATRRLRAALRMFRDCFPGKQLKRWRKQIRRVTRSLGPARDKDVQISFVGQFLSGLADRAPQPGIKRLLLRLKQQRQRLQPKVVEALDRLNSSGAVGDMEDATKAALADLEADGVGIQSPFVFQHVERLILRRVEDLLAYHDCLADPHDKLRHHEMRIVTKRLRYTLEICKPLYEGDLDEPVRVAKRLQTLLGDIHDCDVWTEYLPEFIAEERRRTREYFGTARPFARLESGLLHLQRDRQTHRDERFREVAALWEQLREQGFWDQLMGTVLSRVLRPPEVEPPAPAAGLAEAVAAPAAAAPAIAPPAPPPDEMAAQPPAGAPEPPPASPPSEPAPAADRPAAVAPAAPPTNETPAQPPADAPEPSPASPPSEPAPAVDRPAAVAPAAPPTNETPAQPPAD
jgi:CHAD domain-containing protein